MDLGEKLILKLTLFISHLDFTHYRMWKLPKHADCFFALVSDPFNVCGSFIVMSRYCCLSTGDACEHVMNRKGS